MGEESAMTTRRLLIIGCCGAGKTTLALALGQKLGLPVHHLDTLWWLPNWQHDSRENFDRKLADLLRQDSWIIEGDYSRTLPERLKFADTVIQLKFPPLVCLWRVLKRTLRWYGRHRPDMGKGCRERLNLPFLSYVWNYNKTQTPKLEEALQNFHGRLIRLTSPRDVKQLLNAGMPARR